MKKFTFLAIFFVIFFIGCSNGRPPMDIILKQTDINSAIFLANSCEISIPTKYLGSQSSGGTLTTKRSFHLYGDEIIILENITLDYNFMFSAGLSSIAYAGFEFKNYNTTSIGNFHTYIEGIDRNGEKIYVIAGGIGVFEDVFFIYSNKKETIQKLSYCIQNKDVFFEQKEAKREFFSPKEFIKTDWGAKMLFKHNIIMSKNNNNKFFP